MKNFLIIAAVAAIAVSALSACTVTELTDDEGNKRTHYGDTAYAYDCKTGEGVVVHVSSAAAGSGYQNCTKAEIAERKAKQQAANAAVEKATANGTSAKAGPADRGDPTGDNYMRSETSSVH